jgi:hypothetical protein
MPRALLASIARRKFVATEDFRDFVLKPSMLPRGLFRNFLQSGRIWLSPDKEPSESVM